MLNKEFGISILSSRIFIFASFYSAHHVVSFFPDHVQWGKTCLLISLPERRGTIFLKLLTSHWSDLGKENVICLLTLSVLGRSSLWVEKWMGP